MSPEANYVMGSEWVFKDSGIGKDVGLLICRPCVNPCGKFIKVVNEEYRSLSMLCCILYIFAYENPPHLKMLFWIAWLFSGLLSTPSENFDHYL
jgi:hypothetical protein